MHEINFHTAHEADIFLKQHIKSVPGIQNVYETYLADCIKENIKEMELPRLEDGMIGLMIPKFRYVIKNEDLPVFESLFDGLKTAAGVNFFITETTRATADLT